MNSEKYDQETTRIFTDFSEIKSHQFAKGSSPKERYEMKNTNKDYFNENNDVFEKQQDDNFSI